MSGCRSVARLVQNLWMSFGFRISAAAAIVISILGPSSQGVSVAAALLLSALLGCICLLCGCAWGLLLGLHGRWLLHPLLRLLALAARAAPLPPALHRAPLGYWEARRPQGLPRTE